MALSPYQNKYCQGRERQRERERQRVRTWERQRMSQNQRKRERKKVRTREREREREQTNRNKENMQVENSHAHHPDSLCVCWHCHCGLDRHFGGWCLGLCHLVFTWGHNKWFVRRSSLWRQKEKREQNIYTKNNNSYNQSRETSKKSKLCNINISQLRFLTLKPWSEAVISSLVWCQVTEVKCLLCEEPFVRLLSAMVIVITWKTLVIEIPRHGVSGGWLLEWGATLNLCVWLYTHAALPPHTAWTSMFRLWNTNPQSLSLFRGVCALVHDTLSPHLCVRHHAHASIPPNTAWTSVFGMWNASPQSLPLFMGVCALVHGALTKITVIYLAPRTAE